VTDPNEAGDQLEELATAAYMAGREGEYLDLLARAHRAHLDEGEPIAALRCAFWLGINLARRGETGAAGGWLGRAQRLLESEGEDRVERGYLLLPAVFEREARGEWAKAAEIAGEAAAIGERFGDADLFALAGHEQGQALIRAGEVAAGLSLLDQAMVAASAGELSPIVTGIVYCGVILACEQAHDVRRAREWTATLSRWCDEQPEMVAFTGRCRIHRAEIMQWQGAWTEALAEARRAAERCLQGENPRAAGEACYRQGEIHRLRGELADAEAAFRLAGERGYEPQPGLALLRLAQGDLAAAGKAIERLLAERAEPGERARLLPAAVEIALAAGRVEAAEAAVAELEALAGELGSDALAAQAAHAAGTVLLAKGEHAAALAALRRAADGWQELDAPYEAARARALVGRACAEVGDEDGARMELDAARAALAELDAAPELAGLAPPDADAPAGLTGRELEVLRLVAAGRSNREIAATLTISEHTVARHLQNIFAKLGVTSRTAAGAFAFEHDLV